MTEKTGDHSRFLRSALAIMLLLVSVSVAGFAQPVVDCEDRADEIAALSGVADGDAVRDRWNRHERFVRQAKPGTAYYAPRPFPASRDAVEENFRYAYFAKLFDGDPETLEQSERFIYEELRNGRVKLRIERVENRQLSRCTARRTVPFLHLVRHFDSDGRELSRASIHPTGLLGRYSQVTSLGSDALPDLDHVAERVRTMSGRTLEIERARYAK